MTHDYERHGTTTLFAALDVATGRIGHACHPRHRRDEFLRFMTQIERRAPKGLSVHVILDNYATHKTPEVATWLRHHPRVHFHFHAHVGLVVELGGTLRLVSSRRDNSAAWR